MTPPMVADKDLIGQPPKYENQVLQFASFRTPIAADKEHLSANAKIDSCDNLERALHWPAEVACGGVLRWPCECALRRPVKPVKLHSVAISCAIVARVFPTPFPTLQTLPTTSKTCTLQLLNV
jgi:hypothetical protein